MEKVKDSSTRGTNFQVFFVVLPCRELRIDQRVFIGLPVEEVKGHKLDRFLRGVRCFTVRVNDMNVSGLEGEQKKSPTGGKPDRGF